MMEKYKTGDKCPKSGNWRQLETGEVVWHEEGDIFPPHHEITGENENGISLKNPNPKRAHYAFVNDNT